MRRTSTTRLPFQGPRRRAGVASEPEVEGFLGDLRAAITTGVQWCASPFFIEVVMRTAG